jgi:hypothetical protein
MIVIISFISWTEVGGGANFQIKSRRRLISLRREWEFKLREFS